MLSYQIEPQRDDNGTMLIACPDLPEVKTFGDEAADVVRRAVVEGRGIPEGCREGPYVISVDSA